MITTIWRNTDRKMCRDKLGDRKLEFGKKRARKGGDTSLIIDIWLMLEGEKETFHLAVWPAKRKDNQ